MSQLPEPLTPEHCDLRSHTYFPLHYDRLLRSKWWRRASDFARSRNVDLWSHAFREVPAASLPDDDADLADLAGFGRDIAAFQRVKTELLEPWVLCADGRWYHPTLAEVACDLWDRLDGKRKANAARQSNRRKRLRSEGVTPHEGHQGSPVTRDTPPKSRVTGGSDCEGVTPHEGGVTPFSGAKGNKGKEREGSNEPVASAAPKTTAPKPDPWDQDELFQMIWNACTPEMRRRGKSRSSVWPEWVKAKRIDPPETILRGLGVYRLSDPDVQRTGGPGLHIWLRNRTWQQWSNPAESGGVEVGAAWSVETWRECVTRWRDDGRWDERLGSPPGKPGCRVPPEALTTPTDGAPS